MDEQQGRHPEDDADDLLRRALIDPDASVAVALKVRGLALADALTVVFHGRADLGTIQTYVAHGPLGAGSAVSADQLLRVPCDLDLGDAESRVEAEEAYAEQARTLRDALLAAGTVLALARAPPRWGGTGRPPSGATRSRRSPRRRSTSTARSTWRCAFPPTA